MIGVVIPVRNGWADTKECLDSLYKSTAKIKVALIDGGSTDDTRYARHYRQDLIHLQVYRRLTFSQAANIGLRLLFDYDEIKHVLLLNNDTVVSRDALEVMVSQFFENIGIVTPRINYYDSRIVWSAGGSLKLSWGLTWHENIRNEQPGLSNFVDWATGCALMLSKECWQKVGTFDEKLPWYDSDVDLCLRAKQAGLTIWYTNRAVIEHKIGRSSPSWWQAKEKIRGRYLLLRKHLSWWRLPLALSGFLVQSAIRMTRRIR